MSLFGEHHLVSLLHHYGYGLIGFAIGIESMGFPVPGESLLIAAALYAAATHNLDIGLVILTAAAGAILGDNLGFLIGRRLGLPAIRRWGPRIGLNEDRQKIGQYLFGHHGGKVVFFGRFVAVLRAFAAVLAGANRMEWRSFLLWNAIGGICWASLYGLGAYALGAQVKRLEGPFAIVLAVVAVGVIIACIVFAKRGEARLLARAHAHARKQQDEGGQPAP